MRKTLLLKMLFAAFVVLAFAFQAQAQTGWEQLYSIRAPYCMHVAPNGNMLVADYLFDGTGGIYLSEDKGKTWTKTDAPDYTYGKFIDAGEYIIATGAKCRVARSNDNGKTWEMCNYASALEGVLSGRELDATICYAATMHKGKLYVGDFVGGGVLCSEDFGETWTVTNRESLQYEQTGKDGKPGKVTETIYNLVSFQDELYAFGVYFVFKYDEENDTWIVLRDDSNFMGQSTIHNDVLIMSRTVMNESDECEFLITLNNGEWGEIPRPEGWLDNNIRCLASDGANLYIGFQRAGFWFTADNGKNWKQVSDGLPLTKDGGFIQHIIDLEQDDDYVYSVVYDTPFETRKIDGIYRIAKSALTTTDAIEDVNVAEGVHVDGAYLHVGQCERLTITDLSGKTVKAELNGGKVGLHHLVPGVYIYNVQSNGKATSGKFIKE